MRSFFIFLFILAKTTSIPFLNSFFIQLNSLAPSVPLGLAVIEKIGTSLEIGWNKPEHPNGVIRKYVVVLSRMDGIWRSFIVEPRGEEKHIKFQFIIPNETTEYKITVLILWNKKAYTKINCLSVITTAGLVHF